MTESLKSNIEEVGEIVTQCICFSNGNKKTFNGIIAKSIKQSEMTRFDLVDGRRIHINQRNVDWFETVKE